MLLLRYIASLKFQHAHKYYLIIGKPNNPLQISYLIGRPLFYSYYSDRLTDDCFPIHSTQSKIKTICMNDCTKITSCCHCMQTTQMTLRDSLNSSSSRLLHFCGTQIIYETTFLFQGIYKHQPTNSQN